MNQENVLSVTLLVSLLIHATILASLPLFKNIPQKKELTNIEVTYKSSSGKKSKRDRGGISRELLSVRQRKLPKTTVPQDKPKRELHHKLDLSELSKPKETIAVSKPQLPSSTLKKQRISLKNLPVEMSKDPVYLGYRDLIRKKIQDKVYFYSDQYFFFNTVKEGKIFVTFTIGSNGKLKEFSILEHKSAKDKLLQKIVTTAIQKASPFQKFPKDLKYDERSFNIEISFEIE